MQRFWENVTRTETCWLWTAGKQHNYGVRKETIGKVVRFRNWKKV